MNNYLTIVLLISTLSSTALASKEWSQLYKCSSPDYNEGIVIKQTTPGQTTQVSYRAAVASKLTAHYYSEFVEVTRQQSGNPQATFINNDQLFYLQILDKQETGPRWVKARGQFWDPRQKVLKGISGPWFFCY